MPFVTTPAAYDLLHQGAIALAEIEHNGVRVDTDYLELSLKQTAAKIRAVEEEMRADPIYKLWQRRYGAGTKLTSSDQLAAVVRDLGYKSKVQTAGGENREGRSSASKKALEGVSAEVPFVRQYFHAQELRKARGTYLQGIQRAMVRHPDGLWYVHPHYHLNRVVTFRSSSSDPNWQNVPIRNDEMAAAIRRCYVPRPGYEIVEVDLSQAEVKVSVCYHGDANMKAYVTDPKSDMHRDAARKLFFATKEEASAKSLRGLVKGMFVFAEFYGDYYPSVARNLWDTAGYQKLMVGTDTVYERLAKNGITELGDCNPRERPRSGTFELHVREVERWLWEDRFPGYAQWKRDFYAAYQRAAGFQMLTGFAVNGRFDRNAVVNSPIQGSSFHCILWAMPRINHQCRRRKMRSRVIGQIHDSVVGDVHPNERDEYVNMVRQIMVVDVARTFDWLIVPMTVEMESGGVDGSWYDKQAHVEKGGTWVLKT